MSLCENSSKNRSIHLLSWFLKLEILIAIFRFFKMAAVCHLDFVFLYFAFIAVRNEVGIDAV